MDSADGCGNDCFGRRVFLYNGVGAAVTLLGLSAIVPPAIAHALDVHASGSVRYAIPPTDGVFIDTKNDVILSRFNNQLFAFALACPHQNTALRALGGAKGFQCPRHKSRYQPDGTFISGKATRNMDRLPISREGNEVVVNPDYGFASDTESAKWAAAVVRLSP